MAITRTPIIDDDGSGETGTIINNAWKQELYSQIDSYVAGGEAPGMLTIGASVASPYDIVLPSPRPLYIVAIDRTDANSPITLRTATAGRPGDLLLIKGMNVGAGFVQQYPGAGGALLPFYTRGATTPIALCGAALFVCEPNNTAPHQPVWRLLFHDQGPPLRVPYSAANYNFTCPSSSVAMHDYAVIGQTAQLHVQIGPITLTGGEGTHLQVRFPALSFSGIPIVQPAIYLGTAAGVFQTFCLHGSAPDVVLMFRQDNSPWPAGDYYFYFRIIERLT